MNKKTEISRKEQLEREMQQIQSLLALAPKSTKETYHSKSTNLHHVERGFHSFQKRLETKTDIMKKSEITTN